MVIFAKAPYLGVMTATNNRVRTAFGLLLCIAGVAVGQPLSTETITVGSRKLVLEKGTILVPENRHSPGSRTLVLPYQRLRAENPNSGLPPLFLFDGGPGSSNLSLGEIPQGVWGTRDLVQVGYRGVDGTTKLPDEAFSKALWNIDGDLSENSLKSIAIAYSTFVALCRTQGIDIDGYTMEEVLGDLDTLRSTLGYEQIDVYGVSYGTRLAYLYGRDYPEQVHRIVMVGANPPGHFAVLPSDYDAVVAMYGRLYGKDLPAAMRQVSADMPNQWLWWGVNRGLVKLGGSILLANPETAASVFDAYQKAAAGDASGLAGLSLLAPMMTSSIHTGDLFFKGMGDFVPGRDYLAETSDSSMVGRAFLRGTFGMAEFIPPADLLHRVPSEPKVIEAPTLVLNGSLDTQTPLRGVQADMMPLLKNGSLLVLENYGHFSVAGTHPVEFSRVVTQFLDTGTVNREAIPPGMVSAKPAINLSLVAWGATGATVVGVAALVAVVFWIRSTVHF